MSNQTGIAFKGRDAAYLRGLKNYLESTKRAGQAGVTTPTGQQAIPFIMGIGTVTIPANLDQRRWLSSLQWSDNQVRDG